MPLCLGAVGSVRTKQRHQSAWWAPEVQTFWPLTTKSSPSSTARVDRPARSLPAPGLAHAEAPGHLAPQGRQRPPLDLLLGAVVEERGGDDAQALRVHRPGDVPVRELLEVDHLLDRRGVAAAPLGRPPGHQPAVVEERALPRAWPTAACRHWTGGRPAPRAWAEGARPTRPAARPGTPRPRRSTGAASGEPTGCRPGRTRPGGGRRPAPWPPGRTPPRRPPRGGSGPPRGRWPAASAARARRSAMRALRVGSGQVATASAKPGRVGGRGHGGGIGRRPSGPQLALHGVDPEVEEATAGGLPVVEGLRGQARGPDAGPERPAGAR